MGALRRLSGALTSTAWLAASAGATSEPEPGDVEVATVYILPADDLRAGFCHLVADRLEGPVAAAVAGSAQAAFKSTRTAEMDKRITALFAGISQTDERLGGFLAECAKEYL